MKSFEALCALLLEQKEEIKSLDLGTEREKLAEISNYHRVKLLSKFAKASMIRRPESGRQALFVRRWQKQEGVRRIL